MEILKLVDDRTDEGRSQSMVWPIQVVDSIDTLQSGGIVIDMALRLLGAKKQEHPAPMNAARPVGALFLFVLIELMT